VGVDSLPPSKGNPFGGVGSPNIYTWAAIYDPLTFVSQDGAIQPKLATKWSRTSPTTWQFTLRDGVKFSDGERLTGKGVANVIHFLETDKKVSKSPVAGDLSVIASAKAPNANTVAITTKKPDPILPRQLAELYIPAPQILATKGIRAITDNPVGTGPFKVTKWGAKTVTLTAFDDSWRAPKLGGLVIQELADPTARLQALQSGQVDMITGVSPDQVSQLTGKLKANVTKAAQVMSLAFINTGGSTPIANQKVRQAFNYAVNKRAIANKLLLGKAQPMGQGTVESATGHNPAVQPYPYNPAKAKHLLAAAGYANGFKMTADVVVGSFPADKQMYELMKADLAKVGVNVTLHQVTFSTWLQNYLSGEWGKASAFGLSWNSLPTMDGARSMSYFSCLKTPAFFCDKQAAELLRKAKTNLDAKSRQKQLRKVSEAMHDNPPALYLVRQIDITGLSKDVRGFVDNNRFFPYDQVALK
jgi:peptide/nickel transport system substrate-binding protein